MLSNYFRHKLEKNHHLKSIKKYGEDYILTFKPTHTVNGVTKDVEIGHYLVMHEKPFQYLSFNDKFCT